MIYQILTGSRYSDWLEFSLLQPIATSYEVPRSYWEKIRPSGFLPVPKVSAFSFHAVVL